jgi:hypothetical protein
MTPLEMLAHEYGVVQQIENQRRGALARGHTEEYRSAVDRILNEESSKAPPLDPLSMTKQKGLRVAPTRNRQATSETRRSSMPPPTAVSEREPEPSRRMSTVDLFVAESTRKYVLC